MIGVLIIESIMNMKEENEIEYNNIISNEVEILDRENKLHLEQEQKLKKRDTV